jgi:hypothetical protein
MGPPLLRQRNKPPERFHLPSPRPLRTSRRGLLRKLPLLKTLTRKPPTPSKLLQERPPLPRAHPKARKKQRKSRLLPHPLLSRLRPLPLPRRNFLSTGVNSPRLPLAEVVLPPQPQRLLPPERPSSLPPRLRATVAEERLPLAPPPVAPGAVAPFLSQGEQAVQIRRERVEEMRREQAAEVHLAAETPQAGEAARAPALERPPAPMGQGSLVKGLPLREKRAPLLKRRGVLSQPSTALAEKRAQERPKMPELPLRKSPPASPPPREGAQHLRLPPLLPRPPFPKAFPRHRYRLLSLRELPLRPPRELPLRKPLRNPLLKPPSVPLQAGQKTREGVWRRKVSSPSPLERFSRARS